MRLVAAGPTRELIKSFEDNLPDATPIIHKLHDCIVGTFGLGRFERANRLDRLNSLL